MRHRGLIALIVAIAVPAGFPGVPILGFFLLQTPRLKMNAHDWVVLLIPNVLLLMLVGAVAAGLFLLITGSWRVTRRL